jgi:hypothetical protein
MAVKAQVKHGDCSPCEPSNYVGCTVHFPVLLVMWSKAKVCSYAIAGIMGLSLAEGVEVHLLCLLCVVWVATSAMGQLFVQKSPTVCVCLTVM